MHTSEGILHYDNYPLKLVLQVDQQISDYYRSTLPKYIWTNPQRYPAHVSVVRNETPPNMELWGRYEGIKVPFLYEHHVYNGQVYYWLNVFCSRLEDIRVELGLPISSPYTLPPGGFVHCFHCSVANCKEIY